jgi:hypothetical protein
MPFSMWPLGEPWYAPAVTEGLRRATNSTTPFTVIGQWLDELAVKDGIGREDLLYVHNSITRQLRSRSPEDWKTAE